MAGILFAIAVLINPMWVAIFSNWEPLYALRRYSFNISLAFSSLSGAAWYIHRLDPQLKGWLLFAILTTCAAVGSLVVYLQWMAMR